MKVSKSALMAQLETVRHGLSPRDIVDQASCFAFKAGKVFSFNDEIACWCPAAFTPETGGIAVPSGPLLALLPKLPDEDLIITVESGGMVIAGKNKRATIRTESEIRLPIDTVSLAKESDYFDAPAGFVEGLSLVEGCAGTDDAKFQYTCIHLTNKYMEACDNVQMARYKMKLTGLGDEQFLIRKAAVKGVMALDVKQIAVSGNWMFFRDGRETVVACRRYKEEYPELGTVLSASAGSPAELPKGLGDAATNAAIFSAENADDDHVLVKLKAGVALICGEGAAGSYVEKKRVTYDGPPIAFRIAPKLLVKITGDYPQCEVGKTMMKVTVGRLTYVASLSVPDKKPAGEEGA